MTTFGQELREIAAWFDEHPDVPTPAPRQRFEVFLATRQQLEDIARLVPFAKKGTSESFYWLRVSLPAGASIDYNVWRGTVCTSRVVGTRHVEAVVIPAHDEDIVEWDCPPLLADHAAGAAGA